MHVSRDFIASHQVGSSDLVLASNTKFKASNKEHTFNISGKGTFPYSSFRPLD